MATAQRRITGERPSAFVGPGDTGLFKPCAYFASPLFPELTLTLEKGKQVFVVAVDIQRHDMNIIGVPTSRDLNPVHQGQRCALPGIEGMGLIQPGDCVMIGNRQQLNPLFQARSSN